MNEQSGPEFLWDVWAPLPPLAHTPHLVGRERRKDHFRKIVKLRIHTRPGAHDPCDSGVVCSKVRKLH
jgi:hypothetical protein